MSRLLVPLLLFASLFLASCGGVSSGSSEGSGFTTHSLSEIKAKAREPEARQPELIPDEIIIKVKEGEDTRIVAQEVAQKLGGQVIEVSPPYALIKLRSGISAQSAIQATRAIPKVEIAEQNRIIRIPKPPEKDSSLEPITKVLNALKSTLFRPYSANPNPLIPNDPRFNELWGMHKILAPQAWNSSTGSNTVIVAVIDSGIDYTHEDLRDNMWRNPGETCNDGVDNDNNGYVDDCHGINAINDSGDPMDDNGHGTHVVGTIGAVANNLKGVAGVNWQVKLLACKFIDSNEEGDLYGELKCINYIIALKDRGENIVAVNASYGHIASSPSQMERDAINRLRQKGILFVAAAGNDSWNNDSPIERVYPCSLSTELDNIVCVASIGRSNLLSPFSNYGANTVQVAAPGSAILSTVLNNQYRYLDGTSMAAPHVTGLAALIKAANPNFTYLDIKNRILSTVDQSPSLARKVATGGKINAYRALGGTNPVLLANPIGSGTISGGGIDCGSVCALAYASGTSVSLTATPGQGATLLDWGGSCSHCGRSATCNVTVNGTTNCFVTFYAPLSIDDGRSATVGVQNPPRATQYSFNTNAITPGLAIDFIYDGNSYSRNTRALDFKIASSPNLISFPDVNNSFVSINTPFPVSFYGTQYSQVFVSTNGIVSFGSGTASSSNTQLPNSSLPPMIAAYWDDLYIHPYSRVYWHVEGSQPNRVFVITFENVGHGEFLFSPSIEDGITFQVIFYENDPNRITVQYADTRFFGVTLAVSKSGNGTVTSNTGNINCGNNCADHFGFYSRIKLTASASPGSVFAGWGGDCSACGSNLNCDVDMDRSKYCIARFTDTAPPTPPPAPPTPLGGGGCSMGAGASPVNGLLWLLPPILALARRVRK